MTLTNKADVTHASFKQVEEIAKETIKQLQQGDLEGKRKKLYKTLKQLQLFNVFKDVVIYGQYSLFNRLKYNLKIKFEDTEKYCMEIINKTTDIPTCKILYEYIIASLNEKDIIALLIKFSTKNEYGHTVFNKYSLDHEPRLSISNRGYENIIRFDKMIR